MVAGKNKPAQGEPQPQAQKVVTEAQEKAERLLEDVDELLAQLRGNKQ